MINIDNSDPDFVLILPGGGLKASDFDALNASINDRINTTDKTPNIVIRVTDLPHWDSFHALAEHIRFIRDHHRLVRKVAIVGDSIVLTTLANIADHFVGAKLRHFPGGRLKEAEEWARVKDDDSGHFQIIEGFPDDVVALEAVGLITARDYRDTLTPMVEEKLKAHDKLKMLCVIGEEFEKFSGNALLDDTRFGLSHWADFSRIAVVTDVKWVSASVKLFGPLMPGHIHVFRLSELEAAKSWVNR